LQPLAGQLDENTHMAVVWVVSELVGSSVIHGASKPIDVRLSLEESVDGMVEDHGPGTRAIVRARQDPDPPLILSVVDVLTDEWAANVEQTRICFRITSRDP
jgi:anti-sigma regulatory factor (Ser/Thr protein kinase)